MEIEGQLHVSKEESTKKEIIRSDLRREREHRMEEKGKEVWNPGECPAKLE